MDVSSIAGVNSGNELFDQLTLTSAIIFGVDWLKANPKFSWLSVDTDKLNRAVSWTLAALAGLHISWTWDFQTGDLSVHGLALASVLGAGRSILIQQLLFKMAGGAQASKDVANQKVSVTTEPQQQEISPVLGDK